MAALLLLFASVFCISTTTTSSSSTNPSSSSSFTPTFPSNPSTRSSKKGVVVPHWPVVRCSDFEALTGISWWYNYHTFPDIYTVKPGWCTCGGERPEDPSICLPQDPQAVQFVPMIHGLPGHGNRPNETIPPVSSSFSTILGYNEPNQADKADLSPEEAALGWLEMQGRYPDKILVSPATAGINVPWMDEFMQICEELGCRIDYLATHAYPTDNVDTIMKKLEDYSKRYGGRKIWLTEFARRNTRNETDVIAMIEELLPRLEWSSHVWRYSWFVTRYYPSPPDDTSNFWIDPVNSLLDWETSTLTRVGQAYNHPWHLPQHRPAASS